MNAVKINLAQGSPEWLKWRLSGIGGSDAPVIDGTSPYRTLRELHFEKVGRAFDSDEDPSKEFIFAKGHKTEALIRQQFQELINDEVRPACFQHPAFPHLLASLDGFHRERGVLEGKLVGKEVLKLATEKGEIPAHHYTQLQHQMGVLGVDIGQWFGHDGSKHGALIEVPADPEFIKRLQEKEHEFWSNLKAGKVPALSSRDYLVPDDLALLEQLREAKELVENAGAEFDRLKKLAISTYENQHTKISGAGLILYRTEPKPGEVDIMAVPEVRKAVDKALEKALKLKKLTPGYLEQFRAKPRAPSWTVRMKGGKS